MPMLSISRSFFFIFLSAIFLLEGLGLVDRQFALYAAYLMPVFLFVPLVSANCKIIFPKTLTVFFSLFFLFSFVSILFSVNIERSLNFFVYYLSVFLVFIFVYNFKKELVKGIVVLTFLLTALFLVYSLFLLLPVAKDFSFLIPKRDYQFVYQVYPTHHPLGIFLVVPLSFSLVLVLYKRRFVFFLLFVSLLLTMIFSYFRSSFLAFIITAGFLLFEHRREWKNKFSRYAVIIGALILTSILLPALTYQNPPVSFLGGINQFLRTHGNLGYKTFLSGRDEYWLEAIKGFAERPFFGVGLGNFWNLSLKFVSSGAFADSANLFLDFFAEVGVFGGFVFLGIAVKIFLSGKNVLKTDDIFAKMVFAAFLTLSVLFQAGPGKHYSLILFFFILGALLYSEKNGALNFGWTPLLLSAVILFFIQSVLMSQLYLASGRPLLALYRFPFQQALYQPAIQHLEETGQKEKAETIRSIYGRIFSGEIGALNFLAETYEKKGDKNKALVFYEKSYSWYRFQSFSLVEKVYSLKKTLKGKEPAKQFVQKFLSEYYYLYHQYHWPNFKKEILQFCKKEKAVCTL